MAAFAIQPHGRLQEWVADEKGYFRDEGLDYERNLCDVGPEVGVPYEAAVRH